MKTDETQKMIDESLKHFGILGMRWGVRRDRTTLARIAGRPVVVRRAEPKKQIKTAGGSGHPPSEEAIKTAMTKQKARASGTQALTAEEMKDALKRMKLEQEFKQVSSNYNPGVVKRGQAWIKELLSIGQSSEDLKKFSNTPLGKAIKGEFEKTAKSVSTSSSSPPKWKPAKLTKLP